jgi:hypothetical protein
VISPPPLQLQVLSPPAPAEFYFLGTQDPRVAHLLPNLRAIPKPDLLPALESFVLAVFAAADKVWILDKYFNHQHGLPALFVADAILESTADFRVISKQERPEEWLQAQQNGNVVSHGLRWKRRDHSWLHGRFALVDNELWHFGSTVGGAYPGFDAATRWFDPALVSAFEHQFLHVWKEDER